MSFIARQIAAAFLFTLLAAPSLVAGPYGDDLSKCLVESTSKTDRTVLVKWFFAAASQHPEVGEFASVTPIQLASANKRVADLFVRLLSQSCIEQAKKAIQYEGQQSINSGFQLLGQIAGQELFSSPEVSTAIAGMAKELDEEALKKALGGTPEK